MHEVDRAFINSMYYIPNSGFCSDALLSYPSLYNYEVLYWAPLAGGRQGLCIRQNLEVFTFQSVLFRHHFSPNKSKSKRYHGVNLQNI